MSKQGKQRQKKSETESKGGCEGTTGVLMFDCAFASLDYPET